MSRKERVENTLRSTWLAGLGVYRVGVDSIGEQIDKRYEKGIALLDECIDRGSSINDELMKPVNQFEDKVAELRVKLGLEKPAVDEQLDKLEAKLSVLADKVTQLAEQKAAPPVKEAKPKATETKPAAKRQPASRSAKPAASKPTATKRTTTRTRKAPEKKVDKA